MKILMTILYYMCCSVISVLLTKLGYGINTWQWWTACLCVWMSYLAGGLRNINDR